MSFEIWTLLLNSEESLFTNTENISSSSLLIPFKIQSSILLVIPKSDICFLGVRGLEERVFSFLYYWVSRKDLCLRLIFHQRVGGRKCNTLHEIQRRNISHRNLVSFSFLESHVRSHVLRKKYRTDFLLSWHSLPDHLIGFLSVFHVLKRHKTFSFLDFLLYFGLAMLYREARNFIEYWIPGSTSDSCLYYSSFCKG